MRIANALALVATIATTAVGCRPTPARVNEDILHHNGYGISVKNCQAATLTADCLQHEVDTLAFMQPAYNIYNLGVSDVASGKFHSTEELQAMIKEAADNNLRNMQENTPKGKKARQLNCFDAEFNRYTQDMKQLLERAQDIYGMGVRNGESKILLSPVEIVARIKKMLAAGELRYVYRW